MTICTYAVCNILAFTHYQKKMTMCSYPACSSLLQHTTEIADNVHSLTVSILAFSPFTLFTLMEGYILQRMDKDLRERERQDLFTWALSIYRRMQPTINAFCCLLSCILCCLLSVAFLFQVVPSFFIMSSCHLLLGRPLDSRIYTLQKYLDNMQPPGM